MAAGEEDREGERRGIEQLRFYSQLSPAANQAGRHSTLRQARLSHHEPLLSTFRRHRLGYFR